MDFEKVERFSPADWTDGRGGSSMRLALKGKYVSSDDFDALLSAYRETRRALENELKSFWSANRAEAKSLADSAVFQARPELSTPPEGITK